jgi:hypothetical protein
MLLARMFDGNSSRMFSPVFAPYPHEEQVMPFCAVEAI